jgi:hypothetical protein
VAERLNEVGSATGLQDPADFSKRLLHLQVVEDAVPDDEVELVVLERGLVVVSN